MPLEIAGDVNGEMNTDAPPLLRSLKPRAPLTSSAALSYEVGAGGSPSGIAFLLRFQRLHRGVPTAPRSHFIRSEEGAGGEEGIRGKIQGKKAERRRAEPRTSGSRCALGAALPPARVPSLPCCPLNHLRTRCRQTLISRAISMHYLPLWQRRARGRVPFSLCQPLLCVPNFPSANPTAGFESLVETSRESQPASELCRAAQKPPASSAARIFINCGFGSAPVRPACFAPRLSRAPRHEGSIWRRNKRQPCPLHWW